MPELRLIYGNDRGSKFSFNCAGKLNYNTSCIICALMMFSIELWVFGVFFFTRKHGSPGFFFGGGSDRYFSKVGVYLNNKILSLVIHLGYKGSDIAKKKPNPLTRLSC